MENIEQEIKKIHERNKKVEAEKAWETSYERKLLILVITYIFMVFFMSLIGIEHIFISALVPTFGFFLSTLSLSFIKKRYIAKYLEKGGK